MSLTKPNLAPFLPTKNIFPEMDEVLSARGVAGSIVNAINGEQNWDDWFTQFEPEKMFQSKKGKLSLFDESIELVKEQPFLKIKKYLRVFYNKIVNTQAMQEQAIPLFLRGNHVVNNLTALLVMGMLINKAVSSDKIERLQYIYATEIAFLYAVLNPDEDAFAALTERIQDSPEMDVLVNYREAFQVKAAVFYASFKQGFLDVLGIQATDFAHVNTLLDAFKTHSLKHDYQLYYPVINDHATKAVNLLQQVQQTRSELVPYYLYALSVNLNTDLIESFISNMQQWLDGLDASTQVNKTEFILNLTAACEDQPLADDWGMDALKTAIGQGVDVVAYFEEARQGTDSKSYLFDEKSFPNFSLFNSILSLYAAEKIKKGQTLNLDYIRAVSIAFYKHRMNSTIIHEIISEYMFTTLDTFQRMSATTIPMFEKMFDLLELEYQQQADFSHLQENPLLKLDRHNSRMNFSDDLRLLEDDDFIQKLSTTPENLVQFSQMLRKAMTLELISGLAERENVDCFVQFEHQPPQSLTIQGRTLNLISTWGELYKAVVNAQTDDFLITCANQKYLRKLTNSGLLYSMEENGVNYLFTLESVQSNFAPIKWGGIEFSNYRFSLFSISTLDGNYNPVHGGIGYELQQVISERSKAD